MEFLIKFLTENYASFINQLSDTTRMIGHNRCRAQYKGMALPF
jgi:hypothetical protein